MLRESKSLAVLILIGFSLLGCETSQSSSSDFSTSNRNRQSAETVLPRSSGNSLTPGQKALLEQLHPECKELYRSNRDSVQALECHRSNLNHDSLKKTLEYYR